jgi:transposase
MNGISSNKKEKGFNRGVPERFQIVERKKQRGKKIKKI